jgi:murein DD-endopeptidase MepM/ murein hydrolase activator NlpD
MRKILSIISTAVTITSIVLSTECSIAARLDQPIVTVDSPSWKYLAESDSAKKKKAEEAAQRQRKREELAASQKKKSEDAAALRAKRQEEAALNKKKKVEESIAQKKKQEDAAIAKKKKVDALAAEKKKQREDAEIAKKKKAEALAAEQQKKRDELACKNVEIHASVTRGREFGRNTSWKSCKYKLHFQGDGNLVLLDPSGKVIWATGTEGRATKLALQPDGNVVLYDKKAKALWATNTDRNPGAFFALQKDGNFVVYNGGNSIWASNTAGGGFTTVSAASSWSGSVSSNTTDVPVATDSKPSSNSKPLFPLSNSRETIPNCLFDRPCVGNGSQHTGVDYFADSGTEVKSICNGTVKYAVKGGAIWNRFTIIKHNNCGGYKTLYAYYGHIDPSINVNDSISTGQSIGTIGYYSPNNHHLHFGLSTTLFLQGWGYQVGDLSQKGWLNPESFF